MDNNNTNIDQFMLKRPPIKNKPSRYQRKYTKSMNSQDLNKHIAEAHKLNHDQLPLINKLLNIPQSSTTTETKATTIQTARTYNEDRLKTINHDSMLLYSERQRKNASYGRKLEPTTYEESYNKISNFFDKNQVQDSILHVQSTEGRIRVIDFILKKRYELQNLATKVAAEKAAPVMKDLRDKFKLKNTIKKAKSLSLDGSQVDNKLRLILNQCNGSSNIQTISKQSPKKPIVSPDRENISPSNHSMIIESEDSSYCKFIDTNRLFESVTKCQTNPYDYDEQNSSKQKFNTDSRRSILSKTNDNNNNNVENNRDAVIMETAAVTTATSSMIDKEQFNGDMSKSAKLKNQGKKQYQTQCSIEKKLNFNGTESTMLKCAWALETRHDYNDNNAIQDTNEDIVGKQDNEGQNTNIKPININGLSASSISLRQIAKDKEINKYSRFAQKRLEKDLIKYSINNKHQGIIINHKLTSKALFKQIEKKVKNQIEDYRMQSVTQASTPLQKFQSKNIHVETNAYGNEESKKNTENHICFNYNIDNINENERYYTKMNNNNIQEKICRKILKSQEKDNNIKQQQQQQQENFKKNLNKSSSFKHFNLVKQLNGNKFGLTESNEESITSTKEFNLHCLCDEIKRAKELKRIELEAYENDNEKPKKDKTSWKEEEMDLLRLIRREVLNTGAKNL